MDYSDNIQDFLKPRRGKIKQGYFIPKNKAKYIGDLSKIIYRSNWEKSFLHFCDLNNSVVRYKSEPFSINYYNPLDKRVHKYYVDFYVEFSDGKILKKWLVEVKPIRHTKKPVLPKVQTKKSLKNFISGYKRYKMNRAKFVAASEFAKINNIQFGVVEMVNGRFKVVRWTEK